MEQILSIVLFMIIEGVAILVLREFIISRDGKLRLLMIGYFAVEIWAQAMFYYFFGRVYPQAIEYYVMASLPKAVIKVMLFLYLKNINDKRP